MTGVVVGYVRVSSSDQNTDRQELGGDCAKVFTEKVSGASRERPALAEMLEYVREGDTVRVWSMDRLARSLADLIGLVQELTAKGVTVEFLKERLAFTPGADDPYAQLQLHLLGAFAEFERSIIRSRQAEGIAKAKEKGVYARQASLTPEQVTTATRRRSEGVPVARIARDLGVSRQTLYTAWAGAGVYARAE